jgi:hypothetical protein
MCYVFFVGGIPLCGNMYQDWPWVEMPTRAPYYDTNSYTIVVANHLTCDNVLLSGGHLFPNDPPSLKVTRQNMDHNLTVVRPNTQQRMSASSPVPLSGNAPRAQN